ncbi:MAG: insulinase family protein, partial [Eubacteriaceae bacterium]|nr:insulinase family protein [Eubacteriaceae bacterium]
MLTGEIIHGFLLKEKRYVKEEESTVHVFEHEKSGARLIYMENDEENKVFCISFATLPSDSTGVAHIIEHSVLCGSEKYPLKDPFVKLMNSSLNTFLNAMTFMDKTMYPVASMNEKDFSNL